MSLGGLSISYLPKITVCKVDGSGHQRERLDSFGMDRREERRHRPPHAIAQEVEILAIVLAEDPLSRVRIAGLSARVVGQNALQHERIFAELSAATRPSTDRMPAAVSISKLGRCT